MNSVSLKFSKKKATFQFSSSCSSASVRLQPSTPLIDAVLQLAQTEKSAGLKTILFSSASIFTNCIVYYNHKMLILVNQAIIIASK